MVNRSELINMKGDKGLRATFVVILLFLVFVGGQCQGNGDNIRDGGRGGEHQGKGDKNGGQDGSGDNNKRLKEQFYADSCNGTDVEALVYKVVKGYIDQDSTLAPSLMRLQFHDCFVRVIIAIILGIKFGANGEGTLSKGYATFVVVLICIYVSAFAWSWGPLGWLVPSEIFPLEIRSAGQSINVSVNLLFTFAIAQAFLAMLCHMKFGLFLFFAGFVLIMSTFIYVLLPETKNIPIEEMYLVWQRHWFWKNYVEHDDKAKDTELTKDDSK